MTTVKHSVIMLSIDDGRGTDSTVLIEFSEIQLNAMCFRVGDLSKLSVYSVYKLKCELLRLKRNFPKNRLDTLPIWALIFLKQY